MSTKGKIGVTTENIFPVIKKFLYSDHEIFLRELVANAVDATQKMKALAASGEYNAELGELAVRVELDTDKKTLRNRKSKWSESSELSGISFEGKTERKHVGRRTWKHGPLESKGSGVLRK